MYELKVSAVAYDNPIPGFATNNTINLRLWSAKPSKEFDLEAFNTGDYIQVFLFLSAISSYVCSQCPKLNVCPLHTDCMDDSVHFL